MPSEMLQNLSYFWNNKNQIGFFHFSFQVTLDLLQCSVDIDRNIQCIKFKVARNEIRKKNYYLCFLITKNNICATIICELWKPYLHSNLTCFVEFRQRLVRIPSYTTSSRAPIFHLKSSSVISL